MRPTPFYKKHAQLSLRPLTPDELTALKAYAARHGRTWKDRLGTDWYYARLTGLLHALRNSHGPSWLRKFTLPKGD
ncbi:MAG TPA: hypothetical protein VFP27_16415 [Mycobacterium sp.]|nr:hypothetical protein [Mycobacterium sp.]